MKRIILVLIILIIGFSNTKADCPPGWIPRTLTVTDYPGCTLVVDFCVFCPISSGEMQFQINKIELSGCDGSYLPSILDYLSARILANYFEFCTGTWVPCSEPTRQIIHIRKPLCFYENDEQPNDYLYCDNSWCVEVYLVCVDNNNVNWFLWNKYIDGNPNPQCLNTPWNSNLPAGTCFHVIDCN